MQTTSATPLWSWTTTKLRNSDPAFLIQRLKFDIQFVANCRAGHRYWIPSYLRPVVAAMLPAELDDLVSLDRSKPATVEAANVEAAFLMLDYRAEEAAKMRVGLAIAIWLTGAHRTTLNVVAKRCKDDPDLDQNLAWYLNPRRVQRFKKDLKLSA